MIGYLHGTLHTLSDHALIVCHGVGYEVYLSSRSQQTLLPQLHEGVELFIYTHVREEALELYGFLYQEERALFRSLISVSGVGPRTAATLLNTSPSELIRAVREADIDVFTQTPRVGKKLAQKIIIELRSSLGSLKELDLQPFSALDQELQAGLLQLGFSEGEIEQTLRELHPDPTRTLEQSLAQALKLLGSRKGRV